MKTLAAGSLRVATRQRDGGRRPRACVAACVALALSVSMTACGKKHVVQRATSRVKANASACAAAVPRPPPPPPPPPRSADGSYTVAGLRYIEFVTGGASSSDALPLVFMLHGHGGDASVWQKAFASYAGRARFVAAFGYHRGEKGGYEWFPGGAMKSENATELATLLPDVEAKLAAALAEIARVRPTAGKPIAMGYSQGAALTYALALRHGGALWGVCNFAGHLPAQMLKKAKLPAPAPEVHGFQGSLDTGLAEGQRTISALRKLGFSADLDVLKGVPHDDFSRGVEPLTGCVDRAVRSVLAKR